MWRKRRGNVERRLDVVSMMALLFAFSLIAGMFWMATTGNTFCCNNTSLLGTLRRELFVTEQ